MIEALRHNDPQGFADAAKVSVGYRPLAACALDYALAGVTSVEEVLKVCATLSHEALVSACSSLPGAMPGATR
jgi:MSHA biogenesis protein MshE